jgi:hypothetical protein
MIVTFTKAGAATLWQMVCQPGTQLKAEHWYRAEDSTGEVEMARLHKFCDEVLPISQGEKEVLDPVTGLSQIVPTRKFNECVHSMRVDIRDRAQLVVNHFRKQAREKRGRILPGVFAELDATLKGVEQPTTAPLDDAKDSAQLLALREALAAKLATEAESAPPAEAEAADKKE